MTMGVDAASGATTSGAATAKVPKLSHQLCYTATAKGFRIPSGVVISDALSPGGFVPKIGPAVLNCNPVIKTVMLATGKTKTYPITYPAGHLACFSITEKKLPTRPIGVTNQFGTAVLTPGQPDLLCLPTWKSLTGPPKHSMSEPPYLDHFTCYPVTTQGKFTVPPLTLQDEFSSKPVRPDVSPVPTQLCLVSKKTVNGKVYKVVHPGWMLTCFPVGPTPIKNPVYDENQFGHAVVHIVKTRLLCLPTVRSR
jgi:hypothetical protein